MLRTLITAALLIGGQYAGAETLVFQAKAGQYQANPIGDTSDRVTISTAFKLTTFDGTAAWPPVAYVGFFEGPNRNESFQFLAIRNGGNAPVLTVGYRIIEGGKEKLVETLAEVSLDRSISVDLSFNKGVVTIKYENQAPVTVKTKLTKATPYASVSSGTVEFAMRP